MRACAERKSDFIGFRPTSEKAAPSMQAGIWMMIRNGLGSWTRMAPSHPRRSSESLSLLGQDDTDAFFASRCKILGRTIHRSWLRHVCGRVFATLVAAVTGIPVYDSQCGFKLIRRRCYEAVRSRLREKRFAFDVELLVTLRQSGARIIEVPIDWFDVPGSKLHFVRDAAQMLAAIITMLIRHSTYSRRKS